jgi:hypothetical protein
MMPCTNDAVLAGRDDVYILIAAFLLAHKWLVDYGDLDMLSFASALKLEKKDMSDTEWAVLEALGYRVWVQEDDFEGMKMKFDVLWAEVYGKATKMVLGPSLKRKLVG